MSERAGALFAKSIAQHHWLRKSSWDPAEPRIKIATIAHESADEEGLNLHHDATRGEFCEGRAPIVGVWATVVGVLHVTSRSEIRMGGPESGLVSLNRSKTNQLSRTKSMQINLGDFHLNVITNSILFGILGIICDFQAPHRWGL